jgi:hypothetical protein
MQHEMKKQDKFNYSENGIGEITNNLRSLIQGPFSMDQT